MEAVPVSSGQVLILGSVFPVHRLFAEDGFVFMDKLAIRKEGSGSTTLLVAFHQGYWWPSDTQLQGADLTCCPVPSKMTKAAATFNFCQLRKCLQHCCREVCAAVINSNNLHLREGQQQMLYWINTDIFREWFLGDHFDLQCSRFILMPTQIVTEQSCKEWNKYKKLTLVALTAVLTMCFYSANFASMNSTVWKKKNKGWNNFARAPRGSDTRHYWVNLGRSQHFLPYVTLGNIDQKSNACRRAYWRAQAGKLKGYKMLRKKEVQQLTRNTWRSTGK